MAEFRQGYLDDYTQNSTGVGIGTSSASDAKLEIIGGTTSQELNVTGIATFGSVSGFVKKHTDYTENVNITNGDSGTLSGEIVVGAGLTMTVGTGATTSQGSVDSLKVFNMFQPPSGGTNQRPPAKTGALFYNFDFKTIEFFDGNSWRQVDNRTTSGRGVIHLGFDNPADLTDIHFVNISSKGNSQHFGDLSEARRLEGAASSETRGVFGGGQVSPSEKDTIDYITIQAGGTAIDFGNLGSTRTIHQAFSSSTRAVWGGSYNAPGFSNVMEYVEIGTLGDAVDFGDAVNSGYSSMAVSSPTRGILAGGYTSTWFSSIDFFTIASKGNGTFFGELTTERRAGGRASNAVRGIFAGGAQGPGPAYVSNIDYVTIASAGNAIHFGDLTYSDTLYAVGTSNQTRGIFATGYPSSKTIDSVEIATTGNATDFGEISWPRVIYGGSAVSDCHGGLGGF